MSEQNQKDFLKALDGMSSIFLEMEGVMHQVVPGASTFVWNRIFLDHYEKAKTLYFEEVARDQGSTEASATS